MTVMTSVRKRRRNRPILQVSNIHKFKDEVVDVADRMVCVRFYAPWCRACRAIENRFRQLSLEFPEIKFVEVPLTKENAYLHEGLGVPSLPFAHIYDPSVGLVEERKINKIFFTEFKDALKNYADGGVFYS
jgi:thiol:disulfide interchange protein